MLDHVVEDWVLLLFKPPIGNIGGGQPSQYLPLGWLSGYPGQASLPVQPFWLKA